MLYKLHLTSSVNYIQFIQFSVYKFLIKTILRNDYIILNLKLQLIAKYVEF